MEGQLRNGTLFTSESGNRYEVVSLLGAGGQGEVYDVQCNGRHYALKWYFKGSATARQKNILETDYRKGVTGCKFSMAYGIDCSGSGRFIWLYYAASSEEL